MQLLCGPSLSKFIIAGYLHESAACFIDKVAMEMRRQWEKI